MKHKKIILGITGSIAAYKACDLISLFRKDGFSVTCLLTKEAGKFITPLTLETLSCSKVIEDMFVLPEQMVSAHISLAEETSLVVICPATANIIGKLASAICDDILCCTVVSTKAPVLIAPAMNDKMYKNKLVQKNIAILKDTGYKFIGPVRGRLACGYKGIGHLADILDIYKTSKKLMK